MTQEGKERVIELFGENPIIFIVVLLAVMLISAFIGALIMTELDEQEKRRIQLYKDVKELKQKSEKEEE